MLVSDVAHDIKTILTILKGNLEMLKLKEKAKDSMDIECCKEIEAEIERMSKTSSDLMSIANSEQYAETFKFEKFNLAVLIKELIRQYKAIAEDKMKIIYASKSGGSLYVVADRDKLTILICNLIENALKFRQKKAKLWITLKKTENKALLTFEDNGIGIEKEKIGFIFSPFFQASKTRKNSDKKFERGFGLGLAICKKIVDAHKGKIVAKSEGHGKGTIVEILLPIGGKR